MRVKDLRFDLGNDHAFAEDWAVSQPLRLPHKKQIYVVSHHIDTPDVFDIDRLSGGERPIATGYMESLDKFELACAIAEMREVTEPVTP